MQAWKERGYEVNDSEVDDRTVRSIVGKINRALDRIGMDPAVEVAWSMEGSPSRWVSFVDHSRSPQGRLYVAYLAAR